MAWSTSSIELEIIRIWQVKDLRDDGFCPGTQVTPYWAFLLVLTLPWPLPWSHAPLSLPFCIFLSFDAVFLLQTLGEKLLWIVEVFRILAIAEVFPWTQFLLMPAKDAFALLMGTYILFWGKGNECDNYPFHCLFLIILFISRDLNQRRGYFRWLVLTSKDQFEIVHVVKFICRGKIVIEVLDYNLVRVILPLDWAVMASQMRII